MGFDGVKFTVYCMYTLINSFRYYLTKNQVFIQIFIYYYYNYYYFRLYSTFS